MGEKLVVVGGPESRGWQNGVCSAHGMRARGVRGGNVVLAEGSIGQTNTQPPACPAAVLAGGANRGAVVR